MDFDTRVTSVSVGDLSFELEELVSFEASVDRMYATLVAAGTPETLDELCPYFGVCWPSARALARWLTDYHRDTLRGRRVIELGCGLALPTFTASRLGANAIATDNHPFVEEFFRRNRDRNEAQSAHFLSLDWRAPETRLPEVDWVVASDVLYDAPTADALADFLAANLGDRTRAAVVDPDRPFLERFLDRIEANGLPAMKHTLPPEPSAPRLFLVEIAGRAE
jgi:predicted nicotinamide N-methyase